MAGEEENANGAQQSIGSHSAAFRGPSRKRRKSDSLHAAAETSPHTPLSAASNASLTALADATVSLAAATLPQSETADSEQSSVIERMQRQLEHEREAREAAESEKRRLEEQVHRLEQGQRSEHNNTQHSAVNSHTLAVASHSAPSTPPHHSFTVPATNGAALSSSLFNGSPSSSHASAVTAMEGLPHTSRGVLADPGKQLFAAVSDEDSDERGVSCHQCKSNKPKHLLLFCTTKADSSGRKRRCRKKYCDACLRRSYHQVINHMSAEDLISWRCPSCLDSCTCAACLRRGTVRTSPSSTAPSAATSATPSASSSAVTSPTQRKPAAATTPPSQLSSAVPIAAATGSTHQSASAPSTPIIQPSPPAVPPTLLHGFPYPLAMSGMPTAIPVPFAFQPFAFRPAVVAAAAAAAAAAASASSTAAHSAPPSLSLPTSPATNTANMHSASAGMALPGLLPHMSHINGMTPFTWSLMTAPTAAALASSYSSSSSSSHPQLVINGVRSGLAQPQPQHRINKVVPSPTVVEAAQVRSSEVQSAAAAG